MRKEETLDTRTLEALPSGSVGLQTLAYVTPGFAATQADVGGTRDTWSAQGNYTFYHGKTGTRASFDGFRNQYFIGAASGVGYITDQGNIQELQLETGGIGAESGSGSVTLNAIPKSGSNTFAGGVDGFFSNGSMQAANVRSNLNDWAQGNAQLLNVAGITQAAQVDKIYRLGAQFGGPIKHDKVWFFAAIGRWGSTVNQPSAYYNPLQDQASIGCAAGSTPGHCTPINSSVVPGTIGNVGPTPTLFYPGQPGTPYASLSYAQVAQQLGVPLQQAAAFDWNRTHAGRITYNLNSKNRFNIYGDIQKNCRCTTGPFTGANAIEQERGWDWYPSGVVQATWTAPLTSRLLLDAGGSWQTANWVNFSEQGVTQYDRSMLELSTNYRYGATTLLTAPKARTGRSAERFSVSYVTGTHNFKAGTTIEQAFNDESRSRNNVVDGLNYDFNLGVPARIQYYSLPFLQQERQNLELGIFAQDAWRIRRFTLNLGIRYDRLSMGYPSATLPAGPYVGVRTVTELSGVPTWNDINPRSGISWDVFGNGRTAIKASFGRYNQLSRSDMTRRFHPFTSSLNSTFRTWTDTNGNFIPDCDTTNFNQNGECGALVNANLFGKFITTSDPNCPSAAVCFDPSVTLHNRDYLWDVNVDFQHEIIHGLSVNASYNHNWDGNFTITERIGADGQPLGPSAYDEFCLQVPNDPRLPGAGSTKCGYYDIKPQYLNTYTFRVTNAQNLVGQFGNTHLPQRYWDGFYVGSEGRLPHGIQMGGGLDVGRNVDDHCFTAGAPNQPIDVNGSDGVTTTWTSFAAVYSQGAGTCRVVVSWMNNMDFRFHGAVPIKGGFNASFIFRNTPGAAENALIVASPSIITFKDPTRAASTLTSLTNNTPLNLITPYSLYGDRFNQLDLAVNKTIPMGWGRLRLAFDLYNALNSNSIQNVTTTYSASVVNGQLVSNATANRWLRPTTFLDPRLARVTASISF
jgi:hypothetical protein